MKQRPLRFGAGSAPGQEPDEGGAIFTNAYVEAPAGPSKSNTVIRCVEGRSLFATVSAEGPCRALLPHDGALYAIIDRNVVQFAPDGTSNVLGGLTADGHATMALNRAGQIAVVAPGEYQLIDNGTLQNIADPDLPPPVDVAFLDGYFIFTIADGRLFSSAVDDGTSINALDFTTAEGSPDRNVRGIVRGREFVALGERSIEFYSNDGGQNFPLAPIGGAFKSVGCIAAASAVIVDTAPGTPLVFVSHAQQVVAMSGYSPERISTHDVERDLRSETRPQDIRASTYSRDGHPFYVITGSSWTWVFDFATGQWHNRQSNERTSWRGSQVAAFDGKIICGDTENGSLYVLDDAVHDDAGDPLIWSVRAPAVHMYPNRMRVNAVRVDTLPGRGDNSTSPHNDSPELMIRMSKDGAHTWSEERRVPMGRQGLYNHRVVERRWGHCSEDGCIVEVSCSAAVASGIVADGAIDVDQLLP